MDQAAIVAVLIEKYVGRVVQVRGDGWLKPQKLRIADVELDNEDRLWFWTKYATRP